MDYLLNFPGQLKQHLRSIRKARGLTQAKLAEALGLYQSRIAEIEANPATISVEQFFKVLAALDVRVVLRAEETSGFAPESGLDVEASPNSSKKGAQTKKSQGMW